MSVLISPDSQEGKELARWNRPRNVIVDGVAGMKNVGFEEYPKSIYKAGRPKMANVEITEVKTVRSEEEERIAIGQGWGRTIEHAIQLVHDQHNTFAKLAAERAHVERSMSEKAQAEAAAFESETVQHVPEIPVAHKKRGRPRKTE